MGTALLDESGAEDMSSQYEDIAGDALQRSMGTALLDESGAEDMSSFSHGMDRRHATGLNGSIVFGWAEIGGYELKVWTKSD